MKYIKSMEKFFLGTFFSDDELNIINHQYINSSVFFTEFCHGSCITASNGLDYFVGKLFTGYIQNFFIRILFQYKVSDGMHQMRFSQSGTAVKIERIICLSGRFGYGKRCGMSKFIVTSYYKSIKFIFWI